MCHWTVGCELPETYKLCNYCVSCKLPTSSRLQLCNWRLLQGARKRFFIRRGKLGLRQKVILRGRGSGKRFSFPYKEWQVCIFIINRPGVDGAVLQSASSFIHLFINSVSQPFLPYFQNLINHKPEELGSWNFEIMFTPPQHVTCRMSHVMCLVSRVTCHIFFCCKVVKLISGGSVINGAYPV